VAWCLRRDWYRCIYCIIKIFWLQRNKCCSSAVWCSYDDISQSEVTWIRDEDWEVVYRNVIGGNKKEAHWLKITRAVIGAMKL